MANGDVAEANKKNASTSPAARRLRMTCQGCPPNEFSPLGLHIPDLQPTTLCKEFLSFWGGVLGDGLGGMLYVVCWDSLRINSNHGFADLKSSESYSWYCYEFCWKGLLVVKLQLFLKNFTLILGVS